MHTIAAIRARRFTLDSLARAVLVDVGFGAVIAKMEEYCGVFCTRWIIRLFVLVLFVGLVDAASTLLADTRLYKLFSIAEIVSTTNTNSPFLTVLWKTALLIVALAIGLSISDLVTGRFMRRHTRDAVARIREADKREREADAKIKEAERLLALVKHREKNTDEQ